MNPINHRVRRWKRRAVAVLAVTVVLSPAGFAENSGHWQVPRTEHGYPDLQGFWTNATLTPLQRHRKYGNRLVLTPEEAATLEKREAAFVESHSRPTDPSLTVEDLPQDCGRGFIGVDCGYNEFWVDPGSRIMVLDGEHRSSMITTPKHGRIPALTLAAWVRRAKLHVTAYLQGNAAGPEALSLGERCLMSFGSSAGPPMLPQLYNNHYQIVQSQDTVMILAEMVHDARIIHIGGEHYPEAVAQWMGNSVGRYEGNSLVIETVGLRQEQSFRGSGPNAKFIETLTRVGPTVIKYEFTVEDPDSFTQTWGGELAFTKTDEQVYEYACHEGNYAMPGILAGARREEKDK